MGGAFVVHHFPHLSPQSLCTIAITQSFSVSVSVCLSVYLSVYLSVSLSFTNTQTDTQTRLRESMASASDPQRPLSYTSLNMFLLLPLVITSAFLSAHTSAAAALSPLPAPVSVPVPVPVLSIRANPLLATVTVRHHSTLKPHVTENLKHKDRNLEVA